ncbi:WD repeat-containing protein 53 [Blyttiomyces sp. JEL0837]|nr:WD repeat-containing protein 53 [Blyttiomyces sp. JEL0837]
MQKNHDNICSVVSFRARKPWEIWTGGFDIKVLKWDFSKGRPTETFATETPIADDEQGQSGSQNQSVNPPFVQSLKVFEDGACIAAGLGNGNIMVWQQVPKSPQSLSLSWINNAHSWSVTGLDTLPSRQHPQISRLLVSAGLDGKLALWSISQDESHRGLCSIQTDRKANCIVSTKNTLSKDLVGLAGCLRSSTESTSRPHKGPGDIEFFALTTTSE